MAAKAPKKKYHTDCRHFRWKRGGGTPRRPVCELGKLKKGQAQSCKGCRYFAPEW